VIFQKITLGKIQDWKWNHKFALATMTSDMPEHLSAENHNIFIDIEFGFSKISLKI
jgi:hypothetical protein